MLADFGQGRDQPERADRERALFAGKSVVGLVHLVAQHQAMLGEFVGDGQHGGADPRIIRGQEPQQRHQQRRRVQRGGVVVLAEHAAVVERVRADVRVYFVGGLAPGAGQVLVLVERGQPRSRSAATQHIIFEEVKCPGSPRTSQIPRSGSRQRSSARSTCWRAIFQTRSSSRSRDLVCR
jgi:hypothetical protein